MKAFQPILGQFPLIASANAVWEVSEKSSYNVGIAKSAIELIRDGSINIIQSTFHFNQLSNPIRQKYWKENPTLYLKYFVDTLENIKKLNEADAENIKLAIGIPSVLKNWNENNDLDVMEYAHWYNQWFHLVSYLSENYPEQLAYWDLGDEPDLSNFPRCAEAKRTIRNAEMTTALESKDYWEEMPAYNNKDEWRKEANARAKKYFHPVVCNLYPLSNSTAASTFEGKITPETSYDEIRTTTVNSILKNLIDGNNLIGEELLKSNLLLEPNLNSKEEERQNYYFNYLANYQFIFNPDILSYDFYPFNMKLNNGIKVIPEQVEFDKKGFFRMLGIMATMSNLSDSPFQVYSLCSKLIIYKITKFNQNKQIAVIQKETPFPTIPILRIQAFCPLACGAKSIVYYRYTNNYYDDTVPVGFGETLPNNATDINISYEEKYQDSPLIKYINNDYDNDKDINIFKKTEIYDNIKVVNDRIKNFEGLFLKAKPISIIGSTSAATDSVFPQYDLPWVTVRKLETNSDFLLSYMCIKNNNSEEEVFDENYLVVVNLDYNNNSRCKIYFATGATEILSYSSDGEIKEVDLPLITEDQISREDETNRMVFEGEFEPGDMRIFRIRL